MATLVTVWLVSDVQRRGRCLPYDTDTAISYAWFLIAPGYLLWTRRFRGGLILLGIVVGGVIVYVAGMIFADLLCTLSRS